MPDSANFATRLQCLLWPELSGIAPHHRQHALAHARNEPLDMVETVGVLVALLVTTLLTQYGPGHAHLGDRLLSLAVNVLVALPLLALIAGPFLIRRIRRGLRQYIARHSQRNDTPPGR